MASRYPNDQPLLHKNPKSEARNPKQIIMNKIQISRLMMAGIYGKGYGNLEIRDMTQGAIEMSEASREKPYDLEDRTFLFAQRVRAFVKKLPKTVANIEDIKQLVKASGSVGANYIEANEALGKKDFRMHIKISRKESKESGFWLKLVDTGDDQTLEAERSDLIRESVEFTNIFGSILRKSE
jgi:four helix bundle protein